MSRLTNRPDMDVPDAPIPHPNNPKPCILPAKKERSVTMGIALRCNDGLVLGSDSMISHGMATDTGSFVHYERKIYGYTGKYFATSVVGAGSALDIRAVAHPFLIQSKSFETDAGDCMPDPELLLREELIRLRDERNALPECQLLVGYSEVPKRVDLFRSDGLVLRRARQIEIVGIGDDSLTRFLVESLYGPATKSVEKAVALVVYLIQQAKRYCPQYCGGRTDIEILRTRYPMRIPLIEYEVKAIEDVFKHNEQGYLGDLLDQASKAYKLSD